MLPAPARIAAAPTAKSRPSRNPAVPPPPVTGAALGIRLSDGVGVTVTVAVAVALWGAGVVVATPGALADVVLPEPGVVAEEAGTEEPGAEEEPGAVAEPVTVAEKVGTFGVEDELPLHADTASGASRARAHQQRAVSLAPSAVPAIVTRTFMEPSSCAGR